MIAKSDSENVIRRVYSSIKDWVITYQLAPGERLNIEVLAEELRVSTTPVRECLNRLVAEDLIILVPRMGFFMKSLVESEIRDLYELNRVLLDWSVTAIARNNVGAALVASPEISVCIDKLIQRHDSDDYRARALAKLFMHLSQQSGNSEISLRVRNINDRLHYIRICESEVLTDSVDQILPLFQQYKDCQYEGLVQALDSYHDHRLKSLPLIIRAKSLSSRMVFEGYEAESSLRQWQ